MQNLLFRSSIAFGDERLAFCLCGFYNIVDDNFFVLFVGNHIIKI